MKNLIVILLLFVSTVSCDQEMTTFILVRHAEKVADGTSDPALTEEGIARANKIRSMFYDVDITAIYSTNYRRTKRTCEKYHARAGNRVPRRYALAQNVDRAAASLPVGACARAQPGYADP